MPVDDPRRPGVPYTAPPLDPDALPSDYMALLSVLFGMIGLMFRIKIFAWMAAFTCISSMSTVRFDELDVKQVVCSVIFAIMGLLVNYTAI